MRWPRLSLAGLMTLVAVIALDCATLVHGVGLIGRSLPTAVFLLFGVLPMVNVVGVGLLLLLQPSARR
jgi:hypothetical protein